MHGRDTAPLTPCDKKTILYSKWPACLHFILQTLKLKQVHVLKRLFSHLGQLCLVYC